jgi:hypothetical protein
MTLRLPAAPKERRPSPTRLESAVDVERSPLRPPPRRSPTVCGRAGAITSELAGELQLPAPARARVDSAERQHGAERPADVLTLEAAAELVDCLRVRMHGRAEFVALDRNLHVFGAGELSAGAVLGDVVDLDDLSLATRAPQSSSVTTPTTRERSRSPRPSSTQSARCERNGRHAGTSPSRPTAKAK